MEIILFIGIQATGKSTYFRRNFANTHIRLNMDMLKTRHRESILMDACFRAKQSFVVDNTNPARTDRARYIKPAREHQFRVCGYFFASDIEGALKRNLLRSGQELIPEIGIRGTRNRLKLPTYDEGFDRLCYVKISKDGDFEVEDWKCDF